MNKLYGFTLYRRAITRGRGTLQINTQVCMRQRGEPVKEAARDEKSEAKAKERAAAREQAEAAKKRRNEMNE